MRSLAILSLVILAGCNTSPKSDDLTGEWLALRGGVASGSVFQFSSDHKLFARSVGSDSTTEMQYREDKRLPFDAMHHWITPPNKDPVLWNVGSYDGKLFLFFTREGEEITQQVLEAGPDRIVLSMPVVESADKVQVMERTRKQSQGLVDQLTSTHLVSVRTDTTWDGGKGITNFDDNDAKDEEGHFVLTKLQKIKTGYRAYKVYLIAIKVK